MMFHRYAPLSLWWIIRWILIARKNIYNIFLGSGHAMIVGNFHIKMQKGGSLKDILSKYLSFKLIRNGEKIWDETKMWEISAEILSTFSLLNVNFMRGFYLLLIRFNIDFELFPTRNSRSSHHHSFKFVIKQGNDKICENIWNLKV